ncbi:MAG: hypothetical protein WKG00_25815 [Polyangiaceae bacterium]
MEHRGGGKAVLNDPAVVAFEHATIDPRTFHHREHLYVAWCYLRALPLEEALARYVRHLRRLAAALGSPNKFHATMTWGYMVLLHAAMDRSPDAGFEQLLAEHPALADHRAGALDAHYDRAQLDSDEARRYFVLPRRS